jgi:hypothetical protein
MTKKARDAKTGQYITMAEAKKNPDKSVVENDKQKNPDKSVTKTNKPKNPKPKK